MKSRPHGADSVLKDWVLGTIGNAREIILPLTLKQAAFSPFFLCRKIYTVRHLKLQWRH